MQTVPNCCIIFVINVEQKTSEYEELQKNATTYETVAPHGYETEAHHTGFTNKGASFSQFNRT